MFIGQRGDRFANLVNDTKEKKLIFAGKWRRYNRSIWRALIDIPTLLLNIRDALFVVIGYIQSVIYLRAFKPDAIFIKGGYVGVPVGLAAATLNIPMVTHDSDMIPGLANRIIAKWATHNAVASEAGEYPYDKSKLRVVGVPINPKYFKKFSENQVSKIRENLGVRDNPVVLVLGGSLGAKAINDAMVEISPMLASEEIDVFHVAGVDHEEEVRSAIVDSPTSSYYRVMGFIDKQQELHNLYIVADVVISRAGATNTAELAAQSKASIIIPGEQLADQLVNAKKLEQAEAAVVLSDKEITESPRRLLEAIDLLIRDEELKHRVSSNIGQWANKNAPDDLAKLLIEVANG